MLARDHMTVRHSAERLSYEDACRIAARVGARRGVGVVRLALEGTSRTTTAALCRLVVLRRELLRRGGDLRIAGLQGQANGVYEVCRMSRLLPRAAGPAEQERDEAAAVRSDRSDGTGCFAN